MAMKLHEKGGHAGRAHRSYPALYSTSHVLRVQNVEEVDGGWSSLEHLATSTHSLPTVNLLSWTYSCARAVRTVDIQAPCVKEDTPHLGGCGAEVPQRMACIC